MVDQLKTVEYFIYSDAVWRSPGWPDIPATPVILPTHSYLEIARISGLFSGAPIEPPPSASRNSAVGSAFPGNTNYAIPSTGVVRYVDPVTGSDAATGLVAAPWKTLKFAVSAVGANATIVLRGGTYNEGGIPGAADLGIQITTSGLTIQSYPNEAVWFDGTIPVTGWTLDTTTKPGTNLWSIPYSNKMDRSVQFSRGSVDGTTAGYIWINPANPEATIYDQVFGISSGGIQTELTPVTTTAALAPGKFFVVATQTTGQVYQASKLIIGTNPASFAEVRVTNKITCISVIADNVTLKGFGVRRYATGNCDGGTVRFRRNGGYAENIYCVDCSAVGMDSSLGTRVGPVTFKNCTMSRHGLNGFHSYQSDNLNFENCLMEFNNTSNWNFAPAAGGAKLTACINVRVKNCVFNNNNADGFWCDQSVYNTVVTGCDAVGNAGHGFEYEISSKGWFFDCLAANNLKDGFLNRCSNSARYWNCTASNNSEVNFDTNKNDGRLNTEPVTVFGRDPRNIGATNPVYGTDQMTWTVVRMDFANNVDVNPRVGSSAGMIRLRHQQTPVLSYTTMLDANSVFDGNVYGRPVANSPVTGWVLPNAGGISSGGVFATFTAYKSATAALGRPLDANGYSADGQGAALNSDYSVKAPIYSAAIGGAVPLPADVAAAVGQPVGTKHVGIWT